MPIESHWHILAYDTRTYFHYQWLMIWNYIWQHLIHDALHDVWKKVGSVPHGFQGTSLFVVVRTCPPEPPHLRKWSWSRSEAYRMGRMNRDWEWMGMDGNGWEWMGMDGNGWERWRLVKQDELPISNLERVGVETIYIDESALWHRTGFRSISYTTSITRALVFVASDRLLACSVKTCKEFNILLSILVWFGMIGPYWTPKWLV